MSPDSFDIVVAGAGIIGCASARALSDAGLRVGIVDPAGPCEKASSRAAGLLTPQYESDGPDTLFQLGDRSRNLYPDFAMELGEESGVDVELRDEGTFVLALNAEDETALERGEAWQRKAGLAVERVAGESLLKLEPLTAPTVRWGLYLPNDVQADSAKLCQALVLALERRGVSWFLGESVAQVEMAGDRVKGVRLGSGDFIPTERLIVAAGAWSAGIQGLPRHLPVRPVRGQMVELDGKGKSLRRTLASRRGYVVPRQDGRMLAGTTMEDVGFRDGATAAGVLSVFTKAFEIAPDLVDSPLTKVWAGLRPGTPDDLPILGEDPEVHGLIYATGHFRNGILLAPITAEIVAQLATGSAPVIDVGEFRADRFNLQTQHV